MFDNKELIISGEAYYLRKFKAMKGLELQKKIYDCNLISEQGVDVMKLEPEVIRDIIINGCTKGSITFDAKSFDTNFSGKYVEIFQLVAEILMFNFMDPNAEAVDTEGQ